MRHLLLAALLVLAAAPAAAQCDVNASYTWTAPTTGSPVAYYVVEVTDNGVAVAPPDTTTARDYVLCGVGGHTYTVRVAGVDSLGRQGPWSAASEPYTVPLLPGQPGRPVLYTVVAAGGAILLALLGFLYWRQHRA